MRSYPTNSPQAAARLLAMVLVADGRYTMTEIKALDRLDAPAKLGLSPADMQAVIEDFCTDLLADANGHWTDSTRMADTTRQRLVADVQDPALQERVWHLCEAIARADGHLADGEVDMLDTLAFSWRQVPESSQDH